MSLVKVQMYEEMGRGIQSLAAFMAGDEIMACEILVLTPTDTKAVNSTELKHYTFTYNETQDCLVLGLGEIFNHDSQPNVTYALQMRNGRTMMVFTAARQIFAAEQLFIDYTADVAKGTVDAQEYIDSLSMIG